MQLKPITLESLFYLYCALIYNENTTIRLPSPQIEVAEKIKKILEAANVDKLEMPDHRYQYLLSLLNSPNYIPAKDTKVTHVSTIKYIGQLSKLSQLNILWSAEKTQVEEHLQLYGNAFEKVTSLFNRVFEFKPKFETVYVTRNFDKSGMLIPAGNEAYLILGNLSFKPNIRNLVHELLHAYLEEINLKITENVKFIINKLPDDVYSNYKKPYTVVEESLVRALVVYLTGKNSEFIREEFSEQDRELVLPEKYLKILASDNKDSFSKQYLENLEG